jgi:hypothetical protein
MPRCFATNECAASLRLGEGASVPRRSRLPSCVFLMRSCYLRYALKTAHDPLALLERKSEELHLSPELRSLLERFAPVTAGGDSAERLRAYKPRLVPAAGVAKV